MDHSLCPPIRTRIKPRHNTRNNPCSSSFYSATRFSNQLERHSSNQRQGGWRTATPIANHPPHTGNQSIGSSTPRPSEPSDTTTRPHQLGPSLPQVMTYLTTTRSSRSSCTSRHRRRTNPSSCRTTWFPGVLQRCRSEDSKRWPWLSPPLTHLADQTQGYALQRHTIQQSTRAALIEPETGWLANGDTHRQPPATYGKPEHRLQHTTSERTKRHDHPAPSTRPLTSTGDDLPHHHSQ